MLEEDNSNWGATQQNYFTMSVRSNWLSTRGARNEAKTAEQLMGGLNDRDKLHWCWAASPNHRHVVLHKAMERNYRSVHVLFVDGRYGASLVSCTFGLFYILCLKFSFYWCDFLYAHFLSIVGISLPATASM